MDPESSENPDILNGSPSQLERDPLLDAHSTSEENTELDGDQVKYQMRLVLVGPPGSGISTF